MIIAKYIRSFLDERRRVILPGFGNLEVKMPDKAILPRGNRIDPPGLSVRFDAGFSKDDGELAAAIAEGEELDIEEASQRVLELVDAIKFALDKGEKYSVPDVGTFIKDEDGRIRFKADPAWIVAPDLYGLESMDLLELEELSEEGAPVKESEPVSRKEPEPVSRKEPEPVSRTEPNVTPLASQPTPPKAKKWRVVWLVALALIVILAVLIVIPTSENENNKGRWNIFNKRQDREEVNEENAADGQQENEAGGEISEPKIEVPQSNVEQSTPAEESTPVEETSKYFIIAGSFNKLKNASDMQDNLKERGFQAEVMITENRMYRVSVASFATKEEAEKRLSQITREPGLQSCWLLSN